MAGLSYYASTPKSNPEWDAKIATQSMELQVQKVRIPKIHAQQMPKILDKSHPLEMPNPHSAKPPIMGLKVEIEGLGLGIVAGFKSPDTA